MTTQRTNVSARCERCGKEEKLRLIEYTAWLCEKDYDRILKFLKKLKGNHRTRYQSTEAFINAHKLKD